ncbi:hypothetical protein F8388_015629 [Cannabis sativa]|uniref:TF-B3 domain-containing protein n=1 Tax=Cannabis sativa TaxID=3483 RepID=A0A7J6HHG2_CANSA|nr:hypothetical protein F8388_015629 [Cannabis sativa]KAF4402953.1 hypothetical protein G4B88_010405 [Cannabis sativa]
MLPTKFTKKLGNELFAVAKLIVPSGQFWEVRLEKVDNKIWFKHGWQEFVNFYSISYGNLLIFRYGGESKFHVCILNNTFTEIDYPIPLNDLSSNFVDPNLDNEIHLQLPHSSSKTRIVNKLGDKQVFKRVQTPLSNPKTERSNKIFRTNAASIDCTKASRAVKTEEETPVEQSGYANVPRSSAKMEKEENFFLNHEENTNLILPRGFPHVPAMYTQKNMNQCCGFVHLVVHGNETQKWRIQCLPRRDQPSCRELSYGWSKFAMDNNLKEGDVCVFELVEKGEDIVLKVWIYYAREGQWRKGLKQECVLFV